MNIYGKSEDTKMSKMYMICKNVQNIQCITFLTIFKIIFYLNSSFLIICENNTLLKYPHSNYDNRNSLQH